jgi:hypothetical protein
MKVDRQEIIDNLPQKGFRKELNGDHIYFYHEYQGRETGSWTKVSHSKKVKDYQGDLLTQMRKQLHLETTKQVSDLCKCPMDQEHFELILAGQSFIPAPLKKNPPGSDKKKRLFSIFRVHCVSKGDPGPRVVGE